ncbi:MAG: ATP synthase subunit I [Pseudohongiella sp.]|nr:ATP synthase subunit I [Pseudohongiella sp.]MDO9521003.1 ATP synthase subunit I [Pseudohongiella sp.]MDP2126847.1 ATP synthase subunit I [Pseudohongiella sp.]
MSSIKAPPIYKVTAFQLLFLLVLCGAAVVLTGWISAYSLLIGGLISALPGALFAKKVFKYRGARSTELIVREMYTGEALKLVLISAGFALSFLFVTPLNVMALFSGFILVHITGVLVFVRISKTDRNNP